MVNDTIVKLAIVILRTFTLDKCPFLVLRLLAHFTKAMPVNKMSLATKLQQS